MKNTKPFWKVIYILLVAGIVIMLIGAMLGGIKGTRVNINDYNIDIIDRIVDYVVIDGNEINLKFDKNHEILEGDIEKYFGEEDFDSLDLVVGGAKVEITGSDDEKMTIVSENSDGIQCYIIDGKLYIKALFDENTLDSINDNVLTISLPRDKEYEEFNVTLGAGSMEIEELLADTVNFKMGAGSCEILESAIDNLNLDLGMGDFSYEGRINNEADVSCAMGNVDINIQGNKDDYSYNLECALGTISYEDMNISGIGSERSGGDGSKMIEIECVMGEVSVEFNGLYDDDNEEIDI